MRNPLVFLDFHHHALLNSLIMLFEGRLNGTCMRPIGIDWFPEYWKINDLEVTAKQYLSLDQLYKPQDNTAPLNQIIELADGVYECQDIAGGKPNKAISFEKFKEMKFDILIASIPQHIAPFQELIKLYQPQAKLIYQVGNSWDIPDNLQVKNVMASAIIPNVPHDINFIQYHQEASSDYRYIKKETLPDKNIYSFINCLNVADLFKQDWELFLEFEQRMKEWNFKSYGGQCRDSALAPDKVIANKMREARFIFHSKSKGDGMGHVIHNAFQIGTPPIVRKSDYKGKLAESLIIDGETCITIDDKTSEQIIEEINYFSQPENYFKMSENAGQKFINMIDYHQEELLIRTFLENLK